MVNETAENFSSFKLKISGTGVFPNRKKARVLWLGIKNGNDYLNEIYERLEKNCKKYGFPKDNRKYNPHLTIARLRQPLNSKKLINLHLQKEFEPVEFGVSKIVIIESKLQPTGSKYSNYFTVKLKKHPGKNKFTKKTN